MHVDKSFKKIRDGVRPTRSDPPPHLGNACILGTFGPATHPLIACHELELFSILTFQTKVCPLHPEQGWPVFRFAQGGKKEVAIIALALAGMIKIIFKRTKNKYTQINT